jgi:hypothetical protein
LFRDFGAPRVGDTLESLALVADFFARNELFSFVLFASGIQANGLDLAAATLSNKKRGIAHRRTCHTCQCQCECTCNQLLFHRFLPFLYRETVRCLTVMSICIQALQEIICRHLPTRRHKKHKQLKHKDKKGNQSQFHQMVKSPKDTTPNRT